MRERTDMNWVCYFFGYSLKKHLLNLNIQQMFKKIIV